MLHSFDLADGADPSARLIQGSDGNFYGTTSQNGPTGSGTLFKLMPSGSLNTLHSFCSVIDAGTGACLDGADPYAGLIQGSDGNFYGTTSGGGANANADGAGGTVFKITPSGTLTTLYSFCSQSHTTDGELYCTDGQNPQGSLVQGNDGNFYGTTSLGGANGSGNQPPGTVHAEFGGTVFKITPSGTLTTLYSFCSQGGAACTDGSEPVAGLIQGRDGNFYGTTLFGGTADGIGGTAFKITPSGTLTTLYSFCSQGGVECTDGEGPYAGLIQGSDGNFYGTTSGGGTGADSGGTVFRLTPSGTLTTLYSFCGGATPTCLGGWNPTAGVIQDSEGNFYGSTAYGSATQYGAVSGTAFRLSPSGLLTTLYSFCTVVSSGGDCLDGSSPTAELIRGSDGNFYGTTRFGGVDNIGTVFELSPPPEPGHIKVAPKKLTLKAEPNATTSATVTIRNTGTAPVNVDIGAPKHSPPFSEVGGGTSIAIFPGDSHEVTITYSPTNSTTSKEKSDLITVVEISGDTRQKKAIAVKLRGEK